MFSENCTKDLCLQNLSPDLLEKTLSEYWLQLLPSLPVKLEEHREHIDTAQLLQTVDLRKSVMAEPEKVMQPELRNDELLKSATIPVSVSSMCNSRQGSRLVSRQSSLTDEWFGNITNTNANEISIDSSLEALFANTDWKDFTAAELDVLGDSDAGFVFTPEGRITTDQLVSQPSSNSINVATPVTHIMPPALPQAYETVPLPHTVSVTSLPSGVPSTEKPTSDAVAESRQRTRRKRRISSESQESMCFSDIESQCSGSGESVEDLASFARKFLSDGSRVKPYFWQYNAQSRGPKAQRLCSSVTVEDSHVVPDFHDPVFDNDSHSQLTHSGKARQGDGNDPQPDPEKLLAIGCQIWQLENKFKAVSAETATSAEGRRLANQQKNQLASKICRLKKKALHSANKIKLDGLKQEHDQLMQVISSITKEIQQSLANGSVGTCSLCRTLEQLIQSHLSFMIAGNTAEYVNSELEKVAIRLMSPAK